MTANAGYHQYNTGDVLTAAQVQFNLQNQSVMYFATASARTTAIGSVTVEGMVTYIPANGLEYYNGTSWVTLSTGGDITAVTAGTGLTGGGTTGAVTLNLGTTAKGDLVAGTGTTTAAALTVGSDGSTLVADSSTSTGLRYNPTTGNQNYVINGGFDFFQRGTSGTPATGTYLADRWILQNANAATISQQSTGAPNNSRYVMRIATTGSGQYANMATMLETSMAQQLWGSASTLQVKLRRNSTFNTTITIYLQKSATVDAGNGATWTSIGTSTITNANLPTGTGVTDWVTATVTGTVPNDGTANSLRVLVAADAATGAGAYWELAQVKLEAGSVATAFTRAGGTLQGELAACQRYYYRQTAGGAYAWLAYGGCQNTTNGQAGLVLPVQMRVVPTALEYANVRVVDSSYAGTLTSLALNTNESSPNLADIYVTATGITGGRPLYIGANNNTGAYLAVTAEL
jgi:hypothetical protein